MTERRVAHMERSAVTGGGRLTLSGGRWDLRPAAHLLPAGRPSTLTKSRIIKLMAMVRRSGRPFPLARSGRRDPRPAAHPIPFWEHLPTGSTGMSKASGGLFAGGRVNGVDHG